MQAVTSTKNLSLIINCLEEALNEQDGEVLLSAIKKYKEINGSTGYSLDNFKVD